MLWSLWQPAHASVFFPAGSLQSFSPRSTHSMPGLAKSSFCRARRSEPRNAEPDLSSPRASSLDDYSLALRALLAFVVDPAELEIPARLGDGVELHVGIG